MNLNIHRDLELPEPTNTDPPWWYIRVTRYSCNSAEPDLFLTRKLEIQRANDVNPLGDLYWKTEDAALDAIVAYNNKFGEPTDNIVQGSRPLFDEDD